MICVQYKRQVIFWPSETSQCLIKNTFISDQNINDLAFLQVSRILYSFSTAFKRSSKQASDHVKDFVLPTPDSDVYTFSVSLEVKEDDGKGNFR